MDLAYLKSLIDFVSSSGIDELEVIKGEEIVRIVGTKSSQSETVRAKPGRTTATLVLPHTQRIRTETAVVPLTVNAPMFGVCHLTPAPGAAAFVSIGDNIAIGQMLRTIEAMKMFSNVLATRAGVLKAVLVEGGNEVEANQPLFRIE